MNDDFDGFTGSPLREEELDHIREALGKPSLEQIDRAIEEVERQVAVEDLVLLLVSGVTEAARAFFDFIVEINEVTTSPPEIGDREEETL